MKLILFIKSLKIFFVLLLGLSIFGCSNIKYLKEDENLYTGAELNLRSDEKVLKKIELGSELEEVIKPNPNEEFLGMRHRLWIFNKIDSTSKKKGLKHYLKYKLGEAPVIFTDDIPSRAVKSLKGILLTKGYLNSSVNFQTIKKKRKVSLIYNVNLKRPYTIDSIYVDNTENPLANRLKESLLASSLKKGSFFQIERLAEERKRISTELKDEGYFFFSENYLVYKVDSSQNNNTVKIRVDIKSSTPEKSFLKQKINNVFIYANYTLGKDSALGVETAELIKEGTFYVDPQQQFRPKVIGKTIFLDKGKTYRQSNHNLTLKRLSELNVFKFINIQFRECDSTKPNALDVYIYLTPYLTRSIRAEIEATSKSNNFMGPGISANARNRNFFHGAELLILNVHGGFESQFLNKGNNLYSFELGSNLSLTFPRFVLPFPIDFSINQEIPKTTLSIGFNALNRAGFYAVNTAQANFGYKWNETSEKIHELRPININYLKLIKTTPAFNELLDKNPSLKLSLQEQFIVGLGYSFWFSNQINKSNGNYFFFNANLDVAGNALNLYSHSFTQSSDSSKKILGLPYSQYAKIDFDFRYTIKTSSKSSLHSRVITGVGKPYGNSKVLPYVKQFFIGGSNSIRAFRARSLGPGSFLPDTSSISPLNLDQTGDIKFETNIEFRHTLYKMLKGAIFIDNGNVWALKSDSVSKVFDSKRFLDEIAIGTGLGLRLDVSFFVLRLDWAFPVRIPNGSPEKRWVIERFHPEKKAWRREYLVLNVAIGYPF